MKTTVDLPDDPDLLRRGLSQPAATRRTTRRRVRLPLVRCAHEAQPGKEMTPQRVAEVLTAEQGEGARGPLR
jgi:hypothetical protein